MELCVKYFGLVLLAIWLIVQGLEYLLGFYFPKEQKILPAINLLAGIMLLLYAIKLKRGDVGLFLLGCWAILQSSMFLFHYSFSYSNAIVHILGIVAGVLLISGL